MENNESQITPTNYRQLHPEPIYRASNECYQYKNEVKSQSAGRSEIKTSPATSPTKRQKKVADTSGVVKAFLAIVSVVAIAVAGVLSLSTNVKATFDWLEVSDTAIFYTVSLTDYDGGDTCYVTLQNDFVDRREEITENWMEGFFDDLQPNMYYTLSVKVGNIVILQRTIYTSENRYSDYDYPEYEKPDISDEGYKDNDYPTNDNDYPTNDYPTSDGSSDNGSNNN